MRISIGIMSIALLSPLTALSGTYNFAQCIELIKQNNAQLRSAEENLKSARYDKNAGYSNYLPKVNASLGYSKTDVEDQSVDEGYTAALNGTLNLFNGLSDTANVKSLEGKVLVAEANLQIVKAQLSYDLKSAFANLIYAKDSLALAENTLNRRTENLAMIELRFRNGRENKGSVLLAKAQVQQAKLDVLQAKNQRDVSSSDLARVLGLSPHEEISITGSVPENGNQGTPNFISISESTPQKLSATGQIQSAEASVTSARSGFLPSLDVNGSVGRNDSDFFPQNQRWSVGATLTWNLFDGGKDYFSQKSAFSQKLVAENSWRNTQMDLIAVLKEAYTGFVEALEKYSVSNAFVEAGMVRAEISREKYNNGLSTFDEWDRIESDLISYQKDQKVKKRDKVVAEANWEKTQGVGVVK